MSSSNKTDVTSTAISTNIELIPSFAFIASPLKATAWEASLLGIGIIGRLINHA